MDAWGRFDVAVARWRLGEAPHDDLVRAAENALAAGVDAPGLVELAVSRGYWEITPALRRVLAERGVGLPGEAEAVRRLVADVAERLDAGTIEPGPALRSLVSLAWRAIELPLADDLVPIYLLLDDLDAARRSRAALTAAARELLAACAERRPGAPG